MQSSKGSLVTIIIAVTTIVVVIFWLSSRDVQAPPERSEREAKVSPSRSSQRSLTDRTTARRVEPDDRPQAPKPRRRFGERAPVEADTEGDAERQLFRDKIEALHRWRIESRNQLMTCLPPPGLEVQPHELRVVFEPLLGAPEGAPRRLVVTRFEPGLGVEDPGSFVIPDHVQTCLDRLVGSPLELPEGVPELDEGYEESIDVPWG